MKHRCRVQIRIVGCVSICVLHMFGVAEQVAMALHHALGQAGSAAGVADGGKGVFLDESGRSSGERIVGTQLVEGDESVWCRTIAGVDQVLQFLAPFAQREREPQVRVVHDQGTGATVVDDEFQLRQREAIVEIVQNQPGCRNSDPAGEVSPTIEGSHRNQVQITQTKASQPAAEAKALLAPLGVSQPYGPVDDRFSVVMYGHCSPQRPRKCARNMKSHRGDVSERSVHAAHAVDRDFFDQQFVFVEEVPL